MRTKEIDSFFGLETLDMKLNIEDLDGQRFSMAYELFKEGHYLVVEDILFQTDFKNELTISAISSFQLENITDKSLNDDLLRAKQVLDLIVEKSSDFFSLTKNLKHKFEVVQDDNGKGIFVIAKLIDGNILKC
jgi:hypothetical protein